MNVQSVRFSIFYNNATTKSIIMINYTNVRGDLIIQENVCQRCNPFAIAHYANDMIIDKIINT